MQTLIYLKNFLKDRNIASITPTSNHCVKKICERIDFNTARLFVEFGPATGVFTKYIIKHMHPDARFIAIERNPGFAEILSKNVTDSRLKIVNSTAERVDEIIQEAGGRKADYIISGIPFTFFNPTLKRSILEKTSSSLTPEGKFLVYQFFPQPLNKQRQLTPYLREYWNDVEVSFELFNIPPLVIFEAGYPRIYNRQESAAA